MANPFTPEQISQILEEFFKVVGTRQYIGARYVPIFGRKGEEAIEWDNSAPYEPLTIVLYQGNSYTSRQYVPVGVEITNQEFWALTGNYNAQVEQYRRDVQAFDGRISANATAIDAEKTRADGAERANAQAIANEKTRADGAERANAQAIANEKTRADGAERANAQAIADEVTRAKEAEKANADAIAANASSIADTRAWGRLDTSKKALIFGDSIARGFGTSNPGHTSWGNKLCDKLGITSYNFAVDGASFAINIFDQMATAHASTEFDDSEIGYVFMSGGINDHGRSYDSISTGISKTFNNISTYWPNAKVLFLPLLCAAKPLDSIDQGDQQYLHSYSGMYLLDICHTMFYRNVTVISDGYTWLQGYPEAAADQVHPNDTGANIIANNAYSLLKFGYLPPKLIVGSANWSEKFAAAIKADNSYNFYAMNDRMYKINGKVMFSDVSKLSTGDTIMQLPIQFSGRRDEVHIIMFYNMMSDATDNFKAFIVNGEMKLWTVPSITNTDYYFDYYGIVGVS